MAAILDVQNLCKTYHKAERPAIDHLTFAVDEGAIYAFVGPNGAGKTTTIRIIATLLRPDSGDVCVGGYRADTEQRDVRRLIGFIPDEFGLYGEMLVREYLEFFAGCYGVASEKRATMVADLLELVGLAHRSDDAVQTLSRGMRGWTTRSFSPGSSWPMRSSSSAPVMIGASKSTTSDWTAGKRNCCLI